MCQHGKFCPSTWETFPLTNLRVDKAF